MVISTITGVLLVFGNPLNYATNIIFWTKMLTMVVAAKLAGGLSVALWVNVIVAGRLVPYALTWFGRE